MTIQKLIIAVLLIGLLRCGQTGMPAGDTTPIAKPPAPTPAPSINPQLVGETNVPFTVPTYPTLEGPSCHGRQVVRDVPSLPSNFSFDGNLDDWKDAPFIFRDPIGDSLTENADLSDVFGGLNDQFLMLGLRFPQTTDLENLYLELGNVTLQNQQWLFAPSRLLRFSQTGITEKFPEGWKQVALEFAAIKPSGNQVEILLSRKLIGDTLNLPGWWLRFYTLHQNQLADSTAFRYYRSVVPGDHSSFSITECYLSNKSGEASGNQILIQEIFDDKLMGNDQTAKFMERGARVARLAIHNLLEVLKPIRPLLDRFVLHLSMRVPGLSAIPDLSLPYRAGQMVHLDLTKLLPPEATPEQSIYGDTLAALLPIVLGSYLHSFPESIQIVMSTAWHDVLYTSQLGKKLFFDRVLMTPFDLKTSPEIAAGRMLAVLLNQEALTRILTALHELPPTARTAEGFIKTVINAAPSDLAPHLENMLKTWLLMASPDQIWGAAGLMDEDGDGLPAFVEWFYKTDPKASDTDQDGWSDKTEILMETSPYHKSSSPQHIVADHQFGDWLTLLPNKILFDPGRAPECPSFTDITHFGAIVSEHHISFGLNFGHVIDSAQPFRVEWYIDHEQEQKQWVLTESPGERSFAVRGLKNTSTFFKSYQGKNLSGLGGEWSFPVSWLGLEKMRKDDLNQWQFKIRTVFAGAQEKICDETELFRGLWLQKL